MSIISNLNSHELRDLLAEYDRYIYNDGEPWNEDRQPVGIDEFYSCEYLELICPDKFNDRAFLDYLQANYTGTQNAFTFDLLSNILDYAHENKIHSKDQFVFFLLDLLPAWFSFGEIAQFAADSILTENGKAEKRAYLIEQREAENEEF